MSEATFRAQVRRYLKKHHLLAFVQSFQGTTQGGVPDLLLIIKQSYDRGGKPARYVWLELKAEKKFHVGKLQLWFRDQIRGHGGESYIINHIDSLKEIMANHYNVKECA